MYASELFLYTWGWRENNISLVTHGHTIFPKAICVLVFPILQSKKHEAKNLQPKIVLRKECRDKIFTNTFDSGTFEETILKKILQKVEQWWAWEIELIACYITVRIPPNSLISPGCCILRVCAPAGVYKRVGAPAFLTFCFILLSTNIHMELEIEIMLVSWSGIHFTKKLTLCYTYFRNQISTGLFRFIRNLNKFYFVHVSFYVERGIWMRIWMKFVILFLSVYLCTQKWRSRTNTT